MSSPEYQGFIHSDFSRVFAQSNEAQIIGVAHTIVQHGLEDYLQSSLHPQRIKTQADMMSGFHRYGITQPTLKGAQEEALHTVLRITLGHSQFACRTLLQIAGMQGLIIPMKRVVGYAYSDYLQLEDESAQNLRDLLSTIPPAAPFVVSSNIFYDEELTSKHIEKIKAGQEIDLDDTYYDVTLPYPIDFYGEKRDTLKIPVGNIAEIIRAFYDTSRFPEITLGMNKLGNAAGELEQMKSSYYETLTGEITIARDVRNRLMKLMKYTTSPFDFPDISGNPVPSIHGLMDSQVNHIIDTLTSNDDSVFNSRGAKKKVASELYDIINRSIPSIEPHNPLLAANLRYLKLKPADYKSALDDITSVKQINALNNIEAIVAIARGFGLTDITKAELNTIIMSSVDEITNGLAIGARNVLAIKKLTMQLRELAHYTTVEEGYLNYLEKQLI